MLVIAGHDASMSSGIHIQQAEYVDPARGFQLTEGMNAMGEVRGYHTVSLLLPDGRVLVGGGRTAGANSPSDEKDTFRYYYPGYVFRTRPAIARAPDEHVDRTSDAAFGFTRSQARAACQLWGGSSQSRKSSLRSRDRMSIAADAPSPALMMAWLRPGRAERPTTYTPSSDVRALRSVAMPFASSKVRPSCFANRGPLPSDRIKYRAVSFSPLASSTDHLPGAPDTP